MQATRWARSSRYCGSYKERRRGPDRCCTARMAGDLHGSAPDNSPVALLIIDMINAFDFDGADRMLRRAVDAAKRIAQLKQRARQRPVPTVYVNDSFGRWRSDFHQILEHVLDSPGREIARLIEL